MTYICEFSGYFISELKIVTERICSVMDYSQPQDGIPDIICLC